MSGMTLSGWRWLTSGAAGATASVIALWLIRFYVPRLTTKQTAAIVLINGLSAGVAGAMIQNNAILAASLGLGALLISLSVIDLNTMRLPDPLNGLLILSGLGMAAVTSDLMSHLVGAIAGFGLLWVINRAFEVWKGRAGLGLGDAKMLAGAGAWLGWSGLPSVLVIAAVTAILVQWIRIWGSRDANPRDAFPFGPYLATGLWISWVIGPLTLNLG
jgi:leader peptidase (prepilin peptidase)/N-methyltransferase